MTVPPSRRPGRIVLCLQTLEDRSTPATITVTNLLDDTSAGNGVSLREAIRSINQQGNFNSDVAATGSYGTSDTIQFAPALAGQTIPVANLDPLGTFGPTAFAVTRPMTLLGSGVTIQRNAAVAPAMRLFQVTSTATLTLSDLALSGGLARGGNGGRGAGGAAGMGGAVLNQGTLVLTAVTLTQNQAVGGAGGVAAGLGGSSGTPAGGGGGVGGDGTNDVGGMGGGPNGGTNNSGAGGPGGFGGGGGGGSTGSGAGGPGGFGGGAGSSGNAPGSGGYGGGGGSGATGSTGNAGFGGGDAALSGIFGNVAGGGGGAGMGGAIFNAGDSVTLTNVTFAGNSAQGGNSGTGGAGTPKGGSALGGALYNLNGQVTATNTTFADNLVLPASVGAAPAVAPNGADLYMHQFTGNVPASGIAAGLLVKNTLFASSQAGVSGLVNTGGTIAIASTNNLAIQSDIGGGFTTKTLAELALSPLADNGGPVPTVAIGSSSHARDAGTVDGAPTVDARGELRPTSGSVDVGAYEYKEPQTITFNPPPTTTYGTVIALSATGGLSGNPVILTLVSGPATLSVTDLTATGVGVVTVRATQAGNVQYANATEVRTIQVNPATLTYQANTTTRVYGASNPAFGGTVTGFVLGDTPASATTGTLSFSTTATQTTGVGNHRVDGQGLSATNYQFAQHPGNATALSITRAALTITANDAARTYGQANPTFTAGYSGLVAGDTPAVVSNLALGTAATAASPIGTYTITAANGTAANYTIQHVNGTLTVNRALLTITAEDKARVYGQANPTLTATFSGLVNGETSGVVSGLTLGTTASAASGVGAYTITAANGTADNYTIQHVNGTLTVNRAALTITANDAARTYGQANPTFTATFTGLVNGETSGVVSGLTLGTAASTASGVGAYAITAAGGTAANYTIQHVNGTLTVTRAPLTVTADDKSRTYGQANPPLTFAAGGFVNNDTPGTALTGGLSTAGATAGVGTYPIALGTLAAANYAITYTPGTLTVNRAPLIIRADDQTMIVGRAVPALSATFTGLVNNDTAAVVGGLTVPATAVTPASLIGTYPITPAGATATNYAITLTPGTLTVGPAPATLVGFSQIGVGSGTGGSARLVNPDGSVRFTVAPFGDSFVGGVRTAAADFTGDGVADLVVGTGPGGPTRVLVYDGVSQAVLFDLAPFEPAFTGGVFVTAGDLTGDGRAELVVSPDEGGGPRVRLFAGTGFGQLADFFGIEDPNFRGGARAAVGDLNGDGIGDLVVAAGFGGGPRVAGYDGRGVQTGRIDRLFNDFFAFELTLRNGVYAAAGDVDGDGRADLIAGGGPGGGPRVTVFSGAGLLQGGVVPLANFLAGDAGNRGGVRVAAKTLDQDGKADVATGPGPGGGGRITLYRGSELVAGGSNGTSFDVFPGLLDGVFVG